MRINRYLVIGSAAAVIVFICMLIAFIGCNDCDYPPGHHDETYDYLYRIKVNGSKYYTDTEPEQISKLTSDSAGTYKLYNVRQGAGCCSATYSEEITIDYTDNIIIIKRYGEYDYGSN